MPLLSSPKQAVPSSFAPPLEAWYQGHKPVHPLDAINLRKNHVSPKRLHKFLCPDYIIEYMTINRTFKLIVYNCGFLYDERFIFSMVYTALAVWTLEPSCRWEWLTDQQCERSMHSSELHFLRNRIEKQQAIWNNKVKWRQPTTCKSQAAASSTKELFKHIALEIKATLMYYVQI